MKKMRYVPVVLGILALLASCTGKEKTISAVQAVDIQSDDSIFAETQGTSAKVDIDLSNMNYNMIASVTNDIMYFPERYIGKRIAFSGNFHTSVFEGRRYYSVIIWDATRCCPLGMDFIPPEWMVYPDSCPPDDAEITVIGKFFVYEEEGIEYMALRAENVVVAAL